MRRKRLVWFVIAVSAMVGCHSDVITNAKPVGKFTASASQQKK